MSENYDSGNRFYCGGFEMIAFVVQNPKTH